MFSEHCCVPPHILVYCGAHHFAVRAPCFNEEPGYQMHSLCCCPLWLSLSEMLSQLFFFWDVHFPSVCHLSMSMPSFTCDSCQRYRGSKVTAVFQPVDTPSEFVFNDCITVVQGLYLFVVSFAAPLPMDHIEKMAAECMKDLNEDEEEAEDEDLEKDTDLLVCTTSLARSFSVQNIPYRDTRFCRGFTHCTTQFPS